MMDTWRKKGRICLKIFLLLVSTNILILYCFFSPANAIINEITVYKSNEVRQEPLSTNDSIFGATGLSYMKEFNHDLGMSWRRRDFTWSEIQLNETTWNWTYFDANVAGAVDKGLYSIILLVYGNNNLVFRNIFT